MTVDPIPQEEAFPWLKFKHYAKRVPQITFAFGLYDAEKVLRGVITFGSPCRMLNDGFSAFEGKMKVQTYELNRLCVEDGIPKNSLSLFVGGAIKKLPKPTLLVSYADGNHGHHGYIYQATNWLFTGITTARKVFIDKNTGEQVQERTMVSRYGSSSVDRLPENIELSQEESGKFRYFMFLGDKKKVREMKKAFAYDVLPYPKGENRRYDASFKPATQGVLF